MAVSSLFWNCIGFVDKIIAKATEGDFYTFRRSHRLPALKKLKTCEACDVSGTGLNNRSCHNGPRWFCGMSAVFCWSFGTCPANTCVLSLPVYSSCSWLPGRIEVTQFWCSALRMFIGPKVSSCRLCRRFNPPFRTLFWWVGKQAVSGMP